MHYFWNTRSRRLQFDSTTKLFSDISIFGFSYLLRSLFRFSRKFWQYSNYKGGPLKSDIRKSLSRCCVSCCFNYRFVNSCYWPRAWQEINSTLLRLTFSHFQSVKLSNSRFLIWFVSLIVTFILIFVIRVTQINE